MSATETALHRQLLQPRLFARLRAIGNLCKLRIGATIAFTSLAGVAVTPGPELDGWHILILGLATLISAAAAGGFNQYMETDLDARMRRTSRRPFVSGQLQQGPVWLLMLAGMLILSVLATALVINAMAALYVFLGAFFYGVVYTVWLKRTTSMNIVIGGLAGSFAILAGAAAVNPEPQLLPLLFALVLFLWTPSHFWSFAIAEVDDYRAAGVPMLPVVIGRQATARIVCMNTLLLVSASIVPFWFGMGQLYLLGALLGGGYFLKANLVMLKQPTRGNALKSFHASLLQLTLLLCAAMLDAYLQGGVVAGT